MKNNEWLIYGAYGYTGKLIVQEAVKRGHKPILAGRSGEKLKPMSDSLGLRMAVVGLNDKDALRKLLSEVKLVFNAAGPFVHTSEPIIQACLEAGTNYMDITGEIPVFQKTFSYDEKAKERGIVLMSGVGFDVVPTDCMARYVSDHVMEAKELELAFSGLGNPSAGTFKTILNVLPEGGFIRRNGKLTPYTLGRGTKKIKFINKTYTAMPIPWGDLETAYRSTGIPNITTYMVYPDYAVPIIRYGTPLIKGIIKMNMIKVLSRKLVDRFISGPDERMLNEGHSYVWAMAKNEKGERKEAWLDTVEGYRFTAIAGVLGIEKVFQLKLKGALTPAMAFGADFVLEVKGTKRYDHL